MSDFDISITNQQHMLPLDEPSLRRTASAVLTEFGAARASISVAIVDDETIRELKAAYFNRDEATDVISFDLRDEGATEALDCEIVVNAQRALVIAGSDGDAVAELHLYLVHGLLHQLGFNDDTDERAHVMHAKEDDILSRLNFGKVFSRTPALR